MQDLQRAYRERKNSEERFAYLVELVNRPALDAVGKITRGYAIRLLGVVASESPEIAQRAWPMVLGIARSDGDSIARIMAIGAVIGSKIPGQATDDPDSVSYLDPDTLPGTNNLFDRGFPEWARVSVEFTSLLKDLTNSAFGMDLRLAAIRARAFIADEESVVDLGSLVRNAGEPMLLRQFSVAVLYRSSSPKVWPLVNEIAAGAIPGLDEGYQLAAFQHLMKANLIDDNHEATLQALALDNSKPWQNRVSVFALAGDMYLQNHSVAASNLLLSGVSDANDHVHVECVRIMKELGDREFVAGLEEARAREQDPLMVDYINAALNALDPAGGKRPSLNSRLEELERLLDGKGVDQETRRQYEEEYDNVATQIRLLRKSK